MEKEGPKNSALHERNRHRNGYDFSNLVKACPELATYVTLNKYGNESIDFAHPQAVKVLNKALLYHFYGIKHWDIPTGYLCPPIPGRADYLHYAADLLATTLPKGKKIKVLDIGVGANCVYPIIGSFEYGWNFVGTDIDELAVRNAKNIVEVNPILTKRVEIRLQPAKDKIFKNIIHKEEYFDLVICNPPFHASATEALMGSQRKARNLGHKNYNQPILNFGGQDLELWTDGGEIGFISKMIAESKLFKNQCLWFTSLISKSENLDPIEAMLTRAEVTEKRLCEMTTGNKVTRIVAWKF